MCLPKEEAKTLAERLVNSMDRLTAAIERLEQRQAAEPSEQDCREYDEMVDRIWRIPLTWTIFDGTAFMDARNDAR